MEITGAPSKSVTSPWRCWVHRNKNWGLFRNSWSIRKLLNINISAYPNYILLTNSIVYFMEFVDLHIYGKLRKISKRNYPKFWRKKRKKKLAIKFLENSISLYDWIATEKGNPCWWGFFNTKHYLFCFLKWFSIQVFIKSIYSRCWTCFNF